MLKTSELNEHSLTEFEWLSSIGSETKLTQNYAVGFRSIA